MSRTIDHFNREYDPSHYQVKYVGPDGNIVSYTDRFPRNPDHKNQLNIPGLTGKIIDSTTGRVLFDSEAELPFGDHSFSFGGAGAASSSTISLGTAAPSIFVSEAGVGGSSAMVDLYQGAEKAPESSVLSVAALLETYGDAAELPEAELPKAELEVTGDQVKDATSA